MFRRSKSNSKLFKSFAADEGVNGWGHCVGDLTQSGYTTLNSPRHHYEEIDPSRFCSLGRRSRSSDQGALSLDLADALDESDLEEIQCLLPNGIVLDVFVHPDDEMVHIKQVVLSRATTDGKQRNYIQAIQEVFFHKFPRPAYRIMNEMYRIAFV